VNARGLVSQTLNFESVALDEQGAIVERHAHTAQQFSEDMGQGVTLDLIAVPAGTFRMGSPRGEGSDDERPLHLVRIAAFWLSRSMITQAQWQAVMGKLTPCRFHGPHLPIENVTWHQARTFCERLSKHSGRTYRLPSEAEWEYACRAGSITPFQCGPTLTTDQANYNGEFVFMAEPKGVYRHHPTEAGTFPPNAFGLYDLHGNLWEWCADAWHDDYNGAPTDGRVWDSSSAEYRVVRGGSWHDTPQVCRSAVRLKCEAKFGDELTGFRVALNSA
jgi:formylglycine-generating enzyme required for sulfatase activity